jgi:hypothetical protein
MKVLYMCAAALAAAVMLASPASAWGERGFVRPQMQFHPNFAPQFHPGPRFFGGGPRWGGGGGVIIQQYSAPSVYCYDINTGFVYHMGPCDGTEVLPPDGD